MQKISIRITMAALSAIFTIAASPSFAEQAQLGPRPFFLVDKMADSELKTKLEQCKAGPFTKSNWSIGHRGAALQFPEHTVESYKAASVMGAGVIECDVTFTKDRQLVCRHAQNDLQTSTNILTSPLASTCVKPFKAAAGEAKAEAECRTSEITVDQFKTLNGKMDAANTAATTVEQYVDGTANFRTDLYAQKGTLLTHAESIQLIKSLGSKFTPELKAPSVEMPFEGNYTQAMYAQQMIDEYKAAGIPAADVWPQSFNLDDILYWVKNEPEFGKQAVYLDDSYDTIKDWSPLKPETWQPSMAELKAQGVNIIAPPTYVLVTLENGKIVPSPYAKAAKEAGLQIITWTVERSGFLTGQGGFYYSSIADVTDNEGDVFELLHVLHQDVGVIGVFSDWPATTTFYANCFGLK